jgi:hypothetical protein
MDDWGAHGRFFKPTVLSDARKQECKDDVDGKPIAASLLWNKPVGDREHEVPRLGSFVNSHNIVAPTAPLLLMYYIARCI